MLSLDRQILPPKCHFSFVKKIQTLSKILPQIPNYGNFVKFRQKSVFSSRRPVFRQKRRRNPLEFNDDAGVLLNVSGNYCRAASAFVNDSTFVGNRLAAVMMDSCYLPVPAANVTNFTVAYNLFDHNHEHAIRIGKIIREWPKWPKTKTAHDNVEIGPRDKSKTAPNGPIWMTKTAHVRFKTAHTQVQNGPSTDRNYQSGPKNRNEFL